MIFLFGNAARCGCGYAAAWASAAVPIRRTGEGGGSGLAQSPPAPFGVTLGVLAIVPASLCILELPEKLQDLVAFIRYPQLPGGEGH